MIATKELVRAVYAAAYSLNDRAQNVERLEEYKSDNSVGRVLRTSAEQDRQRYALLLDWVERHRSEAELTEEEVRS